MTHAQISKLFLIGILFIVVFIFFRYGTTSTPTAFYTDYGCVRSVCILHEAIGESCLLLEPTLSKILIEQDPLNRNTLNILIVPSENQCK
jgi:hypothetical protein